MTANADDQALIEGLRRGDDAAWPEAMRRHAGMMHRAAAANAGPDAADDQNGRWKALCDRLASKTRTKTITPDT